MLDLLFPRRARLDTAGWTGGWFGSRVKTNAGVDVDEESTLTLPAAWRATGAIVQPLSMMPIHFFERINKDGAEDRRVASECADISERLNVAPNDYMTAMPWRESLGVGQVNWGNGFSEIVWYAGRITDINPIHPSRVRPGRGDKGEPWDYVVRNNDGTEIGMNADEMLHICGKFSRDGIWGRGVVAYHREGIGAGIGLDRHAASFFGSGAQPKGVLSTPGLKQKEDRAQFRREWREVHASPDSSEIMILPKESAYIPISMSNQDHQFLETRVHSRGEVANIYELPHYMLGEKDSAANTEQKGIEFVCSCLAPWATRQEQQYAMKLLSREQRRRIFCKLDFAELLRGDRATRFNAYRVAIMTGWMTINQVCRMENLNGIGPAGDVNYVPLNQTTAERMMTGDVPAASGSRPGSDQSGHPADSPADHNPEASFHQWAHGLTRMLRDDMESGLGKLQAMLPNRERADFIGAARTALVDVLGRMFSKESLAASREAKNKGDFDAWIREFYGPHEMIVAQSLKPACAILALAGVKKWEQPLELAAWLRARSMEALLSSYGSDSRDVFNRKLAAWPTVRAEKIAEIILRGDTEPRQAEEPQPIIVTNNITVAPSPAPNVENNITVPPSAVTVSPSSAAVHVEPSAAAVNVMPSAAAVEVHVAPSTAAIENIIQPTAKRKIVKRNADNLITEIEEVDE